jgi:hypothetical protein
MLNWLKNTIERIFSWDDEDEWAVATGEEDGRMLICRFRQAVPDGIAVGDFPELVTIRWRHGDTGNNGLPEGEVTEKMNGVEERLDSLEGVRTGFLMMVYTGNQRKEWCWYTREVDPFVEAVYATLPRGAANEMPLEFEHTHDPRWQAWRDVVVSVER